MFFLAVESYHCVNCFFLAFNSLVLLGFRRHIDHRVLQIGVQINLSLNMGSFSIL